MAIAAERIRTISVTRLHPVIGAEISGVDLCRPLDAETLRQIKDAWHKHTVLLFRGQSLSEDVVRFWGKRKCRVHWERVDLTKMTRTGHWQGRNPAAQ